MTQPSAGDGVDVRSQRRGSRRVDGGQASVLRVVVTLLVMLGLLWVVLIGGFVAWLWWPTIAGS